MMSKERELLKQVVEYMWVGDIVEEIKELLAQPEQNLREGLREGLREEISLRDHFAGLAMQGIIAFHGCSFLNISAAYEYADAMMAEREKRNDRTKR